MSEPEMVRRVADAVLGDLLDRRGFRQAWDGIDDDIRVEIREAIGRAAIEALREPTREMVEAGTVAGSGIGLSQEDRELVPGAERCWRAMLDAALTSPPSRGEKG